MPCDRPTNIKTDQISKVIELISKWMNKEIIELLRKIS